MANHSKTSLFLIVLLVLSGWMSIITVEGGQCSEGLGACGTDCQARCAAKHPGAGAQGSCDSNIKPLLCMCYYSCEQPPTPGRPKTCNGGAGLCNAKCSSQCCNTNCAAKYKQGVGFCNTIGTTSLCQCQYPC